MSNIWEVLILGIGLVIQLATLLFFAGKFANRIDALERRMTDSETDIKHWQEETVRLSAIDAKLEILTAEMSRVRDRLDKAFDKLINSL
jgi:hypothetical protein